MSDNTTIRLSFFFSIFILLMVWELIFPKRAINPMRLRRWLPNISLVVLNSVVANAVFSAGAIGVAYFAQANGMGLLNIYSLSFYPNLIISLLFLDFVIYFQHLLFHYVPWLWRLHKIHHSDVEFDVTTAVRFHTIEILISMVIKMGVIFAFGIQWMPVLIFEVLLNGSSMFNHSNIKLPKWVDRLLRTFIVTPDMHRVHHSKDRRETDNNFGFNLPWWDYLFGTYTAQPRLGHDNIEIGLPEYTEVKKLSLFKLLFIPFER